MIENLLRVGPCPQTEVTLTDIKVHCTEVRFVRLITTIVVNPPERKPAKRTSVHCSGLISYHFFIFFQVPQTSLNYVIEKCSDAFAQALRNLSLLTWRHLPMIASFLSRVQFFAQWAVQKHRSDFLHNPISTRSSIEYFK